jgi:hypothetical protein
MKPCKFSIVLLLCLAALLALPRASSTHEPITTKVMFNKEVIRILERNCLGCHAPGKIKADIPLTTYEEARPWAKAIKEEVLEKRMMPFQAVKGYGNFQHDYALPQRDVELLVSWIEGGAPRGDLKDYPKESIDKLLIGKAWELGEPDLVLQPESDARIIPKIGPRTEEEGESETRCFPLPTGLKESRSIGAVDFQPGNGAIVESASIVIEERGDKQACGANGLSIAEWVPGQSPSRLPEGVAYSVPAGARIALKIRYRNVTEPATDRSRVGLYFAKSPNNKAVRNIAISPTSATAIPAGEARFRLKASQVIGEAAEAVAVRPRLFPLVTSLEATAVRPDGTIEVLVWAKNYRFDWQPAYYFKKPVALPKGSRIEVTAYFDNSDDNPNNPNDPPAVVQVADALCELALVSASPMKPALVRQSRR